MSRAVRRRRPALMGVVLALEAAAVVLLGTRTSAGPSPWAPPTPIPRQAGCTASVTRDPLCIIVLGDSIAVGVPVDGDGRWWVRLERLLATALPGRTIDVDNWAVSGSQVDVLESAARDQPAVGTYDIAIVIEGVNDQHVLTAAAWQPRYEAAIAMLESKGLTVIVTAPPPSFENGAFGTRFDPFAEAVRDVASRGRPLLDIAGRWHADGPTLAGTYYVDGIHQGAEGQVVMATMARDLVFEALGTTALGITPAARPMPAR